MSNGPFNIIQEDQLGTVYTDETSGEDATKRIEKMINSSKVFLFMKGIPGAPQCGFSANVVGLLESLGVKFKTFDVLSDMDIRQGVKEYSNWPTIPQLYIDGKFVGGNDIAMEMHQSGDLKKLVAEN